MHSGSCSDRHLIDVILFLFTKCIACSLSNDVIKLMVYRQAILHFSGFLVEFQSFLVNGAIRNVLVWNEDDDILTDVAQCILEVVVTSTE